MKQVLKIVLNLVWLRSTRIIHGWKPSVGCFSNRRTTSYRQSIHSRLSQSQKQLQQQQQQQQHQERRSLMLLSSVSHSSSSSSSSSSRSNPSPKKRADFEYQELKILLETMKRERVPSRDLPVARRREMELYIRQIIAERPSSIPFGALAKVLPQSLWRLGFSTEAATLGDLPRDATVLLEFVDDQRVNYILQFSEQTFALKRLVAKSTYHVQEGPVDAGLVTFVYDEITTDVFGFSNIGVGLFGLLKGRANYVETAYFDGTLWLERGLSPTGEEYFNAYVRES